MQIEGKYKWKALSKFLLNQWKVIRGSFVSQIGLICNSSALQCNNTATVQQCNNSALQCKQEKVNTRRRIWQGGVNMTGTQGGGQSKCFGRLDTISWFSAVHSSPSVHVTTPLVCQCCPAVWWKSQDRARIQQICHYLKWLTLEWVFIMISVGQIQVENWWKIEKKLVPTLNEIEKGVPIEKTHLKCQSGQMSVESQRNVTFA